MNLQEWCAVAHVDISPRTSLELGQRLMEELVASAQGAICMSVLQQPDRANHFEVIGRFVTEDAYLAHLAAVPNLTFREGIAPTLGSPYEDRLHGPRTSAPWPQATAGDFVALTQIEVRPAELGLAETLFDELAAAQRNAEGLRGQVALQRRTRSNNLELISTWTSPEAFEAHFASASPERAALTPLLVAPIDDRRHHLLYGQWATD
jgi:quinol monooxygenase YgiN